MNKSQNVCVTMRLENIESDGGRDEAVCFIKICVYFWCVVCRWFVSNVNTEQA